VASIEAEVVFMAANPKGPQKARLDYNIDKPTYDAFAKMCASKGYAPNIIVEKMMKKYVETGQF
jgi:hypothetical protein